MGQCRGWMPGLDMLSEDHSKLGTVSLGNCIAQRIECVKHFSGELVRIYKLSYFGSRDT